MKEKTKIDDLKWIRVFTPSHIPTYLVEQIRDRDFTIEDFYKYHEVNCTVPSPDGNVKLNPFSHLYVLANEENQVKGMLWFCVDPLAKDLIIQTFSMDKEYWMKGIAVKKLAKHIKEIRKKGNLNKIYWVTNYPKHSERNGFKRAKAVLMEYNEENEVNHGKDINGGEYSTGGYRATISGTEQLSEQCIGATAAATG